MFFIKKSTIYTLFAAFLLVNTFSCNLLDQKSPNDVAEEDVFKDADGLRSVRIGMYSAMQQRDYFGGHFHLVLDGYTDNGATGGYDNANLNEVGEKALTSANLYVEQMWTTIYNVVGTANHILANIDKVTDMDKAEQDDIKGEALFIRAMGHFDALRVWGEHWNNSSEFGVPILKQVQRQSDVATRSSVSAAYEAILSDLTVAENLVADEDIASGSFKGQGYVTKKAVKALLARVYLYKGDKANAAKYAQEIIGDNTFSLFPASKVAEIYTGRLTNESIFELIFDTQNRSGYNALTYSRPDALRPELTFLANASLDSFFINRPNDARATLIDFANNDVSIQPDGRTQKYRGEQSRDNPAYILRLAEMYLIAAEAKGGAEGLTILNQLRTARGMAAVNGSPSVEEFATLIADERRAELNMEGHRYFDLARTGKVKEVLGDAVLPCFPIPLREVGATNGALKQYTGY